jgi:acetyltransferase-like isoleucine patch superfamily enzyme
MADSILSVRLRFSMLVFLLPASRPKNWLLNRLGHQIHPTARFGICWVQGIERFEIAEGVQIGNFNAFRYLKLVQIGRGSRIVMFNWILGGSGLEPGAVDHGSLRTFRMGEDAHVISMHYLDCGGGLIMGDNSWITGIRSTVLSHAFDPVDGGLVLEPVTLEKAAVVSTNCTLLPGVTLGEGALLAAGSTAWTRQQVAAGHLHGGVPARRLAPITIEPSLYERRRYEG